MSNTLSKIDVSQLFEDVTVDSPFPDELDAVLRGSKPLSWSTLPRASFDAGDEQLTYLAKYAHTAGLLLITHYQPQPTQPPIIQEIDVFVVSKDHLWRVSALLELDRLMNKFGWSENVEA